MSPLNALRSDRISRWTKRLPRFAVGAAWFFILFSLAHLAWVIGVKWDEPAGLTTLYQTTVLTLDGPETHRAWGMAYNGVSGLLLALLQTGVILGAAVMSLRTGSRAGRIGHGILVGWSALWMLNLMHLAGVDGRLDSIAQASLMTLLCGCTTYRAIRSRRMGMSLGGLQGEAQPVASVGEPAAAPNLLTEDDVSSSKRVREIPSEAPHESAPTVSSTEAEKVSKIRRTWWRGRDAASRVGAAGHAAGRGIATRSRPLVTRIGRSIGGAIGGATRRVSRKLRNGGVIPRRAPSTSS